MQQHENTDHAHKTEQNGSVDLTLDDLSEMLTAVRGTGALTGSASKDQIDTVEIDEVESLINGTDTGFDSLKMDLLANVVAKLVHNINKFIDRRNLIGRVDADELASDILSRVIDGISSLPEEYNMTKSLERALIKMLTYNDAEYVEYYFSPGFEEDVLKELGIRLADDIKLSATKKRLRLRTAQNNRDPVGGYRDAIEGVGVLEAELLGISSELPDDQRAKLASYSRDKLLTVSLGGLGVAKDEALKITRLLCEIAQRVPQYGGEMDDLIFLQLAAQTGFDEEAQTQKYVKKVQNGQKLGRLGALHGSRGAMFSDPKASIADQIHSAQPNTRNNGLGRVPPAHRGALRDIPVSEEFTVTEKEQFEAGVVDLLGSIDKLYEKLGHILEGDTHDALVAIRQNVANVIHAADYIVKNGDVTEPTEVKMGSQVKKITLSKIELFKTLSYLNDAFNQLSKIELDLKAEEDIEDKGYNTEFGYAQGTDDTVLILTKKQKAKANLNLEFGGSPRINFIVGMGNTVPSTIVDERWASTLSLRFDFESGKLVFDIGGKSDYPYSPDYIVAKTISFGAQIGGGTEDYHTDVASIGEEESVILIEKMRDSLVYSSTSLRLRNRNKV